MIPIISSPLFIRFMFNLKYLYDLKTKPHSLDNIFLNSFIIIINMKVKFDKINGIGNDYIFIDCINQDLSKFDLPELTRKLSNRNHSIGSDGLILLQKSEVADFKMTYFNDDGSPSEMCGNGMRGFTKFIYDNGLSNKKQFNIETLAGIIKPEIIELDENNKVKTVRINMGNPIFEGLKIPTNLDKPKILNYPLTIDGNNFKINAISMGNPHGVIFVDEITDYQVLELGPKIQKLDLFPNSANIEFIKVISKNELEMRVYERGSGETLACGTGACASAVAAISNGLTNRKVLIHLLGGDLEVEWDEKTNDVFLTGPVELNFKGEVEI